MLRRVLSRPVLSGRSNRRSLHTCGACSSSRNSDPMQPVMTPRMATKSKTSGHWFRAIHPFKTNAELAEYLCDTVVYEDDDMIVLSKPTQIPVKINQEVSALLDVGFSENITMSSALPSIKNCIGSEHLQYALVQPREISGITVISKNDETTKRMRKYFQTIRAHSKNMPMYLAITVGIPKQEEMSNHLPLRRLRVSDFEVTVVSKSAPDSRKRSHELINPIIQHRIISRNSGLNCSLVELQTNTVKWDSLQVYLAHMLCPALGDHLYSNRVTTVMGVPVHVPPVNALPGPQRLGSGLMKALEMTDKHLKYVPLHLHCSQLTLPRAPSKGNWSRTVKITANLPEYFTKSLTNLKIDVHKALA